MRKAKIIASAVAAMLFVTLTGPPIYWYIWEKPIFQNRFGFGGRVPFIPYWHRVRTHVWDQDGRIYLAEYRRNIVLVIETAGMDEIFEHPKYDHGGFGVRLGSASVWITPSDNLLIWVKRDGSVRFASLEEGQAEAIFANHKLGDIFLRPTDVLGRELAKVAQEEGRSERE